MTYRPLVMHYGAPSAPSIDDQNEGVERVRKLLESIEQPLQANPRVGSRLRVSVRRDEGGALHLLVSIDGVAVSESSTTGETLSAEVTL